MSRPTRPICINCAMEMRCIKTGAVIELLASFGSYELWHADVYECPGCNAQVVPPQSFAHAPVGQHHEQGYTALRARLATSIYASVEHA